MATKFIPPQITNPYTTEMLVAHASKVSERVQLLEKWLKTSKSSAGH